MRRPFRPQRFAPLVVIVLLFAAACGSPEERARTLIARAEAHEKEGRLADAAIDLRNALRELPTSADINFQLANLLQRQQRFADALFFFQETSRLDPTRHDALLAEAKLLYWEDPEKVETLLARVRELAPAAPELHVRESEFALVRGDAAAALEAALTAVEIAPESVPAWIQLGKVHQARILEHRTLRKEEPPDEWFAAAIDAFERADQVGDGVTEARIEHARVLSGWPGREAEASPVFRTAIDLAVERGDAEEIGRAASAAVLFGREHDPVLARDALAAGLIADPGSIAAWAEFARLTEETGGDSEAVYARLIRERPDDPRAQLGYAEWLAGRERVDDAIAHLEQRAADGVAPAQMLERMLELELARGHSEAAQGYAERLRGEEFASDPDARRGLARLALNEGRTEEARTLLREVVGAKETAEAQRLLALAEFRLGATAAALAAIDRTLALEGGDSVQARRLRARIVCAARDWLGCIEAYRTLSSRAALAAEEQVAVAQAMYQAGRREVARQWLERMLEQEEVPPTAAMLFSREEGTRDPEAAQDAIERALAQHPDHPDLLRLAVLLDLQAGAPERALARLDAQQADDAPTAPLDVQRARALLALGRADEAEAAATRAFERAPELPETAAMLLAVLQSQGRSREAQNTLEAAAREGRLSARNGVLLARLYLDAGDHERARPLLERALDEVGELPGIQNDLAFVLAQQGEDLERAMHLAEKALEALPDEPIIADTLGFVYLRKGLYEPALRQFDFAIAETEAAGREVPAEFRFRRGVALRHLARNEEAVAELERVLGSESSWFDDTEVRAQIEQARSAAAAVAAPSS